MSPRRYSIATRAAAAEARRAEIVSCAIELFAEQTAAATTMEDIAQAARVAPATVYRHFRNFDALAQACAETAFNIVDIPTPQTAVAPFAEVPSLGEKLMRFIEIDCHCFERTLQLAAITTPASEMLTLILGEIPKLLGAGITVAIAYVLGRVLAPIVTGLLEPVGADDVTRSVVVALVDFPFWESLRRGGVPAERIPDLMFNLVSDQLRRTGIKAARPKERKQR